MKSLNTTLSQRGAIYGDYEEGSQFIASIMGEMEAARKRQGYLPLTEENRVHINYILLKLTRIMITPNHVDSWHDLAGYAKLTEEVYEKRNGGLDVAQDKV